MSDGLIEAAPKEWRPLAWFVGVIAAVVVASLIAGAKGADLSSTVSTHEVRIKALEDEKQRTHDMLIRIDDYVRAHSGPTAPTNATP